MSVLWISQFLCSFSLFIVLNTGSLGYHRYHWLLCWCRRQWQWWWWWWWWWWCHQWSRWKRAKASRCFHRSAADLGTRGLSCTLVQFPLSVIPIFCLSHIVPFFLWCFFKKQEALWTTDISKHLKTSLGSCSDLSDQWSRRDGGRGRGGTERGMEFQVEGEEKEDEEVMRKSKRHASLSVLDPPDGLDLGGVGVGAELAAALVLASAHVTLQDVLVATVARVLVAHESEEVKDRYGKIR